MNSMYVDLGYREPTHITIVSGPGSGYRQRVIFKTIDQNTCFVDTLEKIEKLMIEHKVHPKDFYAPGHPSVEHRIHNLFGEKYL